MKHLIIDVETLGLDSRAVILQFVAALYDGATKETKIAEWKLSVLSQKEYGRTIDVDTRVWWTQQNIEVQKASYLPSREDIEADVAMNEFATWLGDNGFDGRKDLIWQRGSMDHDWLSSLFSDCGWLVNKQPIRFFRVRDIRTAVDVLGYSEKLNGYPDNTDELKASIPNYKQHDARSDVMFEIAVLQHIGLL